MLTLWPLVASLLLPASGDVEARDLGRIAGPCLAPVAPDLALPRDVLLAYRAELSAEHEAYFVEVSRYLDCLDRARSAALDEARQVAAAWSAFVMQQDETGKKQPTPTGR